MDRIWAQLEMLTTSKIILYSLLLTVFIEAVTILMRFGFKLQATRDTTMIGRLTFGWRIHHGYIGLVLLLVTLLIGNPLVRKGCWIVGTALLLSDLIHHFLVLWPITGSHEFDIRYPRK